MRPEQAAGARYRLTLIKSIFAFFVFSTYFSTIDLEQAYLQLPFWIRWDEDYAGSFVTAKIPSSVMAGHRNMGLPQVANTS